MWHVTVNIFSKIKKEEIERQRVCEREREKSESEKCESNQWQHICNL